jgi:hypothetical protein
MFDSSRAPQYCAYQRKRAFKIPIPRLWPVHSNAQPEELTAELQLSACSFIVSLRASPSWSPYHRAQRSEGVA